MSDMRTLGNTAMKVVPVGLGCMDFSHAYGAPTQKLEAVRMIHTAYEMGYNFFDTAECYIGTNADGSTSYNEELVGEALADVRDKGIWENLGAKNLTLTAEEIRQMDELLDRLQMPVYGQRAGRN